MTKTKRSFLQKLIGKEEAQEEHRVDYEPGYSMQNHMAQTEVPLRKSASSDIPLGHEPAMRENEDWIADQEGQLTIDVYQTDSDIVIKSTIAGVKPEDLDVQINNDMVVIKGERIRDERIREEDYYYQECYWGAFSRSIILPVDVQANKAEATMKNGILTIRLPKADSAQSRKIQVRGY